MNSLFVHALTFKLFYHHLLIYILQLGSWAQPAGPSLSGNASDLGLSGSVGPRPGSQTQTSGEAVKECVAEVGTSPSSSPSSQSLATGDIW